MWIPLQSTVGHNHHWTYLHSLTSAFYNAKQLIFSFIRIQSSDGFDFAQIVVFRDFVVEMIHQCRRNSNFIVYSLADPLFIIPHLILIEMYYNYVRQVQYHTTFRLREPLRNFRFDYIIGSLRDRQHQVIPTKSMLLVSELVGDLSGFQEIYIIDDRAESVWNHNVPPKLSFIAGPDAPKIFPVQPSTFSIFVRCEGFRDLIRTIKRDRMGDAFFLDLIDFIEIISKDIAPGNVNGSLLWTRYRMNMFQLHNGTAVRKRAMSHHMIGSIGSK